MDNEVTIVEVSPRDGLQNEGTILTTDAKVELITRLADAGARRIEAVSFAHPRLVPTMADAEAVMERVPRRDGLSYAGLILNRKGLDRAVGAGVDEVNVVVCVSDTFSGRNQNVTADEAMRMAADVVAAARDRGPVHDDHARDVVRLPVRGRGGPGAGRRVRPPVRRLRRAGALPGRHGRRRGAQPGRRPHGAHPRPGRRPDGIALPLPQHPQHRLRQRLRGRRRGRGRAGRERGRDRGLPVRAEGDGQHRHGRPRLHAGTDGSPDRDRPHDAHADRGVPRASSSATRCPRCCRALGRSRERACERTDVTARE